ncbi:MAG: hypothetical protein E7661_03770 [Ruminococcaceae bacterium]|nr:hypothetical protein [Oscillospiraceae bacterium]
MGRSLGYFDSEELDRPELNKCPECECYFASEECPLCGKVCPEAFRAGNRAAVKKPKRRRNASGRVQFIPWYHTWWFILIMMFAMPVVGIILFFSSPYSKTIKIIGAVLGILYFVFIYLGVGWMLLDMVFSEDLVNDKISREAYVARCDDMSPEEYHRDAYNEGNYVTMELTVASVYTEAGDYYGDRYYLCRDQSGGDLYVLLLDCSIDKKTNYLEGDMIRVYGECSGIAEYDIGTLQSGVPCLYMAYSELVG